MITAMILHAFTGDTAHCWLNRQPNEILFTAQNTAGYSFNAIVPGAMLVQLLAPESRTLPVTAVIRDGEVFRAQLARLDDEPAIHSGLYLASVFAVVSVGGDEFTGTALASVHLDEDLPQVARPPNERATAGKSQC